RKLTICPASLGLSNGTVDCLRLQWFSLEYQVGEGFCLLRLFGELGFVAVYLTTLSLARATSLSNEYIHPKAPTKIRLVDGPDRRPCALSVFTKSALCSSKSPVAACPTCLLRDLCPLAGCFASGLNAGATVERFGIEKADEKTFGRRCEAGLCA